MAKSNSQIKVNFLTSTNGTGHWNKNKSKKFVEIYKLELLTYDIETADGLYFSYDMKVFFYKKHWNYKNDGLIYGDKKWLNSFRRNLIKIGFSKEAVKAVDYSEQGLQGQRYVHIEIFGKNKHLFADEFLRIKYPNKKQIERNKK